MESKILVGIVGVVISIILVGSLLMPVIGDATSSSEEIEPVDGGYGTIAYQGTPEESASIPYRYINTTYSNDVLSIKTGPANALVVVASINISELSNTPQIIYADDNQTIYIDNNLLQFSGTITKSDVALNNAVNVQYYNDRMTYSDGNGNQYVDGKITYYYRCSDTGDYANFVGNDPPAMDTPSVSVDGVYIGEKYHTVTVENPLKPLYYAIPVLIITAVLVFAVGVFISKRY